MYAKAILHKSNIVNNICFSVPLSLEYWKSLINSSFQEFKFLLHYYSLVLWEYIFRHYDWFKLSHFCSFINIIQKFIHFSVMKTNENTIPTDLVWKMKLRSCTVSVEKKSLKLPLFFSHFIAFRICIFIPICWKISSSMCPMLIHKFSLGGEKKEWTPSRT